MKLKELVQSYHKIQIFFPHSDRLQTRKAVILKFNTLYYRIMNDKIEILSFFSKRQSPDKKKL